MKKMPPPKWLKEEVDWQFNEKYGLNGFLVIVSLVGAILINIFLLPKQNSTIIEALIFTFLFIAMIIMTFSVSSWIVGNSKKLQRNYLESKIKEYQKSSSSVINDIIDIRKRTAKDTDDLLNSLRWKKEQNEKAKEVLSQMY